MNPTQPAPSPPPPAPLDGLLVIALEHAVAAPLCTRHLAELGARVIKIERPGQGDFARDYDRRARGLHFVWCNRAKQSLTLDLKADAGQAILQSLVARADVVVQNLAPGAAARLGLGWDVLHAQHPRLVLCDISGYGEGGPMSGRKAYDLLIQAEAGYLSVTGLGEVPVKSGTAIADIAAGMSACNGVLAALLQRGRTGRGSHVEVSMLEALAESMGFPLYYALDGASPPARSGAAHATICPYGPFRTGGGRTVLLGVQNEREWHAFCHDVLQQPALATDARFAGNAQRHANREALHALIESVLASLDAEAVRARLDAAGIANAQLNTMADVWAHPQLAARDRVAQVDSPVGPLPALRPVGVPHDAPDRMGPVPALGEHTGAILQELGYSPAQVDALRAQGVV